MANPLVNVGDAVREQDALPYRMARWDAIRNAQGIIAETGIRNQIAGPLTGASGTYFFAQVWLKAGEIITGITMNVGTAAVAETFAKGALHDVNGVLLASTPDQGAAWGTVGAHPTNFSVAFQVITTGIYYAGFIIVAGTTPAIAGYSAPAATRVGLTVPVAGKPLLFGSTPGLADVPSPLVVAAGTAPGMWWLGLF